jgi:hypothetical protein
MPITRLARLVAGVLAACVIASCNTDRAPTAPPVQPELIGDVFGTTTRTLGTLLTCRPLPAATASAVIGPAGGTLRVGPHTLVVPPRALAEDVRITAFAPSDTVNSVDFQPDGLRFRRSAALTLSYANCGVVSRLLPKRVAWITDDLRILEILPSVDDPLRRTTTGQLDHFSRYAVSY